VPRFCLSAVGADRPGIVAGVTGVLVELDCNLEDSTMTILQGWFAILLVVSAAPGLDAAAIEAALGPVAARFELLLSVRPLGDTAPASSESGMEPWTFALHGADHSGIVHGVTAALAEVGGNVVDLATHLVGAPDAPVYVMTLRVTLPADPDPAEAAERVRSAAESLGVHCSAHPDDADTL
jgi:glycine cleavage system transcriptional repressor